MQRDKKKKNTSKLRKQLFNNFKIHAQHLGNTVHFYITVKCCKNTTIQTSTANTTTLQKSVTDTEKD